MGGVNMPPMLLMIIGFAISTTFWPGVTFADESPEPLKYVDLWTSKDGETHLRDCIMHNFTLEAYADGTSGQYVRSDFGGTPHKVVFTEFTSNVKQKLHSPPAVQFVITVRGAWCTNPIGSTVVSLSRYINTTDGDFRILRTGDILFQDDTRDCPSDKIPQHLSGNWGPITCQQFIAQINKSPEVDNFCRF